MLDVVILAAGQGTRMKSELPKVLHELAGRPLLQHVIDTAALLAPDAVHVVIGHGAERVQAQIAAPRANWIQQEKQLGTGHAVQQTLPVLAADGTTLILYGDVPLVREATLRELLSFAERGALGLLTIELMDPTGYGRILRDRDGGVAAIVEHKDATAQQREVREVNTGIMAVPTRALRGWLGKLGNANAQGEYYLTDIVAMAVQDGIKVEPLRASDVHEVSGVNNRRELATLERAWQQRMANELMLAGVTLRDPARFDLRGRLQHGRDVEIDINVVIEGDVVLGNNVTIGPNCVLSSVRVGDGARIHANSVLEDADIGPDCSVGPFARLRPGTRLAAHARVGNFVETKKALIGRASKVNHLSYVGDAEIGEDANIGAGTITCNYDGVNKFKTIIGARAFIGSNTALVAPVEVGADATVGAGSVITDAVPNGELAVARGKQRNISGWKRPQKKSPKS
jgi:bifunctional UDP-N-acetylglucosamine pyrophosphorylase / glucosamine-1-phosphate N-acetyltransferase